MLLEWCHGDTHCFGVILEWCVCGFPLWCFKLRTILCGTSPRKAWNRHLDWRDRHSTVLCDTLLRKWAKHASCVTRYSGNERNNPVCHVIQEMSESKFPDWHLGPCTILCDTQHKIPAFISKSPPFYLSRKRSMYNLQSPLFMQLQPLLLTTRLAPPSQT